MIVSQPAEKMLCFHKITTEVVDRHHQKKEMSFQVARLGKHSFRVLEVDAGYLVSLPDNSGKTNVAERSVLGCTCQAAAGHKSYYGGKPANDGTDFRDGLGYWCIHAQAAKVFLAENPWIGNPAKEV